MLPNISSAEEYGLPKIDFDSEGVVDPQTECLAAEYEALAVDVAAMSQVSPRAIVACSVSAGAIAIEAYRSVWGGEAEVWPTAEYVEAGLYRLTWNPSGYPDLNPTPGRRFVRAPNFVAAVVQPTSATSPGHGAVVTANQVQVHLPVDGNFCLLVY